MKKLLLSIAACLLLLCSCETDASVASHNLSKAADQFEIYRRVVFYNSVSDKYMLSIQGFCSIEDHGNKLTVTVKTPEGNYLKHYLGRSENVTYFAEQLEAKNVSKDHYKVIFKPSTIVPIINIK